MNSILNRLNHGWSLLAAMLFLACGPAYAVHDPAPIPQQVIQKIIDRHHGSVQPTPGEALEAHLDEILRITKSAGKTKAARQTDTENMLLNGKRAELQSVLQEVRHRFGGLRAKLGAVKRGRHDALLNQVESRFGQLDKLLADASSARSPGKRAPAMQRLRDQLEQLQQARRRTLPDFGDRTITTFSAEKAPPSRPINPSNKTPAYLAQYERPDIERNWLQEFAYFLVAEAQAAPPATPPEAVSCAYTAADLADDAVDVKITQEIKDLAASLNYSPARIFEYVSNTIRFETYYGALKGAVGTLYSQAGGATDQASLLIALLRASNIPARYVQGVVDINEATTMGANGRAARWVGAKNSQGAAAVLSQGENPTVITFTGDLGVRLAHVWVEACVPYVNYRGIAADNSGHRWLPLDPGFKDKSYQAGITTAVSFDYTSFLATRSNTLPHESLETQIDTAIKALDPNNTLNDVPYNGTINPIKFDVLPATLPYEVNIFTNWSNSGTPETSALPDTHRYQFNITVNGGDIVSSLRFTEIVHDRLTLSFEGATAPDQAALDAWVTDGNPDSIIPCGITVVPSLKREGVEIGAGGVGVDICSNTNLLDINISLEDGRSFPGPANSTSFNNIGAANYYSLQGYAYQGSDRLLAERVKRLVDSVNTSPDPNTNLDETEGEFLHIAGLKYMRHVSDAEKRIGELSGESGDSGHHIGVSGTQTKVQYLFDLPLAVRRAGLLVDMPGVRSNSVDLTTGNIVFDSFKLGGYSSSNFESFVWQENARVDAISTVRGLQFANENGIEVLTLNSANWFAESQKFTSNANSALNYSASQITQIKSNYIDQGFTVTAPRSLIQYDTWLGAVFVAELDNLPSSASAAFIISGGYAGGYSILNPPPGTDYDFLTGTQGNINGVTPYITAGGDPVNMVNGNMYHTETDIHIAGRGGFPFIFERYYNSNESLEGPLGFGWTHSYNHFLRFNDDDFDRTPEGTDADGITSSASWIDGTGAERIFAVTGDPGGVPIGSSFANQAGVFVTVNRDAGGTYSVRSRDGLTYTFENVAGTLGQTARLVSIQDRNANTLALTYDASGLDSVTDDLGRTLDFTNTGGHVAQIQDWTGRTWQYQYDANDNLSVFLNPLAVAGTIPPSSYDYYVAADGVMLDHKMKSFTLSRGNGMTFEYYANGKVFRHFNTLGETITFNYNEFRRESSTVNERGHVRSYFFDGFGNMVKLIEETGAQRHYVYDAVQTHNRLSKTDPMGLQTQFSYDTAGNVTSITNPSGSTVVFSNFTAFNQPGKIKDANNNYSVYQYNANGNLTNLIKLKNGIDPGVPSAYVPNPPDIINWTVNTYDGFGNRVTSKQVRDFTTQEGPVITYTYDANSLYRTAVIRCGDQDGDGIIVDDPCDTETIIYDALGRFEHGIRNDWEVVEYVYDDLDRIIRSTDSTGQLRDFSYDENGNSIGEKLLVNVSGTPTQVDQYSATYDLSERLATEINSGGFVTRYEYDAAGNLLKITDPDNYSIGFEYDEDHRIIKAFDREGHAVTRDLDDSGRLLASIDSNGNATTYHYYDSTKDGWLQQVTDAANKTISYDYDNNGNITAVNDNLGRTTVTTFNALNLPVRVVGPQVTVAGVPARTVTRNTYDNLGNLTIVEAGYTTDLSGNSGSDVLTTQSTDQFDDFGRKIRSTDALGRSWSYQYDVHDNIIQITDPKNQQVINTYDFGGQLLTRTAKTSPSDPSPHVTTWTRNALGQVTEVNSPEVIRTYSHDAAHRITSVTDSRGNKALNYQWSPGGLLDGLDDSDGNETDYLYDPAGRLVGVWAPNGDLVTYAYDAGGRMTEKWMSNGVTTRYQYSPDNALQSVTNTTDGSTVISQHDYTYDPAGNRDTHTETIGGSTNNYAYLYDALNRLAEVQIAAVPVATYTYDALGNRVTLTEGGTTLAYVYDDANQLTAIRLGSVAGADQVTLGYDLNGNLQTKTDLVAGTSLTLTHDVLDQVSQAVLTGSPAESYLYGPSGKRLSKTVGGTTTNYLYKGPDIHGDYDNAWSTQALFTHGPGMDDPILRDTGSATAFYHQDGLGSVIGTSDIAGVTLDTQRYDAWGNTVVAGNIPQYGYTGREPDATGLIYYRARYYDPQTGRFAQRDPIGFAGGDINLYTYVGANPVNAKDPDGEIINFLIGAGTSVVVGGVIRGLTGGNVFDAGAIAADAALGAVGVGVVSKISKLNKLRNLGNLETIAQNRLVGEAAETLATRQIAGSGNTLLGNQVSARTAEGLRRLDNLVQTPSGQLLNIEVKSGNAVRNASQLSKDGILANNGGTLVGRNAPDFLRNTTQIIGTQELNIARNAAIDLLTQPGTLSTGLGGGLLGGGTSQFLQDLFGK